MLERLERLNDTMSVKELEVFLKTHQAEYIYVFTDGRIFFTDQKLNEHTTFTKLLKYNVHGYTAYAKMDTNLPLNQTLYKSNLSNHISARGTIALVKQNVFAPIPPSLHSDFS